MQWDELFARFLEWGVDLHRERWSLLKISAVLDGMGKLNKRREYERGKVS